MTKTFTLQTLTYISSLSFKEARDLKDRIQDDTYEALLDFLSEEESACNREFDSLCPNSHYDEVGQVYESLTDLDKRLSLVEEARNKIMI
jgi:hypothetical protein